MQLVPCFLQRAQMGLSRLDRNLDEKHISQEFRSPYGETGFTETASWPDALFDVPVCNVIAMYE